MSRITADSAISLLRASSLSNPTTSRHARHAISLLAVTIAACTANNPVTTQPLAISAAPAATPPAPTVTVAVTPQVLQPNNSTTITWTTTNATSCQANGAWSGSQALSNATGIVTSALTATGTYTYGLTCVGAGGSGSATQQVFVGAVAAPSVSMNLTPTAIQPGDAASLTWSSTNAIS
jgi:hypothetical protein